MFDYKKQTDSRTKKRYDFFPKSIKYEVVKYDFGIAVVFIFWFILPSLACFGFGNQVIDFFNYFLPERIEINNEETYRDNEQPKDTCQKLIRFIGECGYCDNDSIKSYKR